MVNLLALNLITQLISPDALDKLIDSWTAQPIPNEIL